MREHRIAEIERRLILPSRRWAAASQGLREMEIGSLWKHGRGGPYYAVRCVNEFGAYVSGATVLFRDSDYLATKTAGSNGLAYYIPAEGEAEPYTAEGFKTAHLNGWAYLERNKVVPLLLKTVYTPPDSPAVGLWYGSQKSNSYTGDYAWNSIGALPSSYSPLYGWSFAALASDGASFISSIHSDELYFIQSWMADNREIRIRFELFPNIGVDVPPTLRATFLTEAGGPNGYAVLPPIYYPKALVTYKPYTPHFEGAILHTKSITSIDVTVSAYEFSKAPLWGRFNFTGTDAGLGFNIVTARPY